MLFSPSFVRHLTGKNLYRLEFNFCLLVVLLNFKRDGFTEFYFIPCQLCIYFFYSVKAKEQTYPEKIGTLLPHILAPLTFGTGVDEN